MADSHPTKPNGVVTLSAAEVAALADRLAARGASLIFKDMPNVSSDMATGAKVIRSLTRELRAVHSRLTEILLAVPLDSAVVLVVLAAGAYPVAKVGPCPAGYTVSGNYCAPIRSDAPAAIPKVGQCPAGWSTSGGYCLEMRRR